jgi:hypothetical protein
MHEYLINTHPTIWAIPKNKAYDFEIHKVILNVSLPTGVSPPTKGMVSHKCNVCVKCLEFEPWWFDFHHKKHNQLSYAHFAYMHEYVLSISQIHCLSYAAHLHITSNVILMFHFLSVIIVTKEGQHKIKWYVHNTSSPYLLNLFLLLFYCMFLFVWHAHKQVRLYGSSHIQDRIIGLPDSLHLVQWYRQNEGH